MNETHRGKFISIHGIDGTGKTTTTQEVVRKLSEDGIPVINYDTHRETINNPHEQAKNKIDRSGSLEEKLAVYLESMMFHSAEIDRLLSQGFHVVKSRYLDDIKAHFSQLGIPKEKVKEFELKFPMVQPDLKVILILDETERRKRIDMRGILDDRDVEEKTSETRLGFLEDYLFKAAKEAPVGSVLHIDTSMNSVNEVVKKIVDHLLKDL